MNWPNKPLWNYAEAEKLLPLLDRDSYGNGRRPPVFLKEHEERNILIPPHADEATRAQIIATVPKEKRHLHFRSMKSSQALTQSVFGNLKISGLDALTDLESDQGLPAFGMDLCGAEVRLEYEVAYLGEPRRTEVDVFIRGARNIAVECKFTEKKFGECSRPKMNPEKDGNYERDFCDGSYMRQRGRKHRCSLSAHGVQYWRHVPELFHWQNDRDWRPCPLRNPYQIVRNLLAACLRANSSGDTKTAHVLIIYDDRNPTFQNNGASWMQFDAARNALKDPSLLRSCSWQAVVRHLAKNQPSEWLAVQLQNKYDF